MELELEFGPFSRVIRFTKANILACHFWQNDERSFELSCLWTTMEPWVRHGKN